MGPMSRQRKSKNRQAPENQLFWDFFARISERIRIFAAREAADFGPASTASPGFQRIEKAPCLLYYKLYILIRARSLVAEHPVCIRKMGVRFLSGPKFGNIW